ncbi:hypothetical protein ACRAWF_03015 [Streptomyces sp. L7]
MTLTRSTSTLAAKFVLGPGRFDVVVASNPLGDILSDWRRRSPAASASPPRPTSTPERDFPSMFERRARLRPRHRRARHGQPARCDLVRRDDAGPPRPPRGGRNRHGRDRRPPVHDPAAHPGPRGHGDDGRVHGGLIDLP